MKKRLDLTPEQNVLHIVLTVMIAWVGMLLCIARNATGIMEHAVDLLDPILGVGSNAFGIACLITAGCTTFALISQLRGMIVISTMVLSSLHGTLAILCTVYGMRTATVDVISGAFGLFAAIGYYLCWRVAYDYL